ncbi:preprotein translocase subunit SecA [Marinithermus hydrothermalis]|uniref:Protein translocase subunit SecA n=1 Tax=Marinithermus hydrothermalis (strain DSM 14884 / JCM 11576 / T1) TaxID=869210 RepID=F2NMM2_MARHT|nr:preprotein translocase subunit SecA [Marinithermus hydrothermalis]AEB12192.1 Protein translocase subunit secA [Marinithermus hydrothermalis DSM 14884]
MLGLLKRIFDNNEREIQRYWKTVVEPTNALEAEVERIDDLAKAYAELREQHQKGASLDELLPRVFALTRESAKRYLGMRHYDVQLIGGAVLHEGKIAEMKTGEGKTLVATLPVALNALTGKGVHLVTVNDYLARRDAEWMRPVYRGLGLTVGVIQHSSTPDERRQAYLCDVTYVTNSELGFDYLRDNMALSPEQLVLRHDTPLHYAIVDEVDSILVDEARTPLIISGPAEKATDLYYRMAELAQKLERGEKPEPGEKDKEPTGDYTIDEKQRSVHLTERGIAKAEKLLGIEGLFSPENMEIAHMLIQAIRAKELYFRDRDYIVQDGQVIIVDEFTGRLMPGRRYGEGLHQAIEAKEGVKIERENQTLATITYQNFFRQYEKVAGMTGTAKTEEKEFQEIYGMDVIVVPTNRPVIRQDHPDVVYRSERGKFFAVVEEIAERYERGQPVLVGTISIEKSERLSAMLTEPRHYLPRLEMRVQSFLKAAAKQQGEAWERLKRLLERPANLREEALREFEPLLENAKGALKDAWEELKRSVHTLEVIRKGIPHQVLNAKHHEKEAEIVAQAGRSGTVTIATNMAGRGTDIKLGGNPEHMAAVLLEKQGFDRYEWKVELFIKKLVQGEEGEARALAAELGVSEETIEEIKRLRDACREDEKRVKELGGLAIIGTERHESRRIDNQLRGRAGRQGDPGESRFYVSFDDDLMRLFASDRVVAMLDRMGFDDSEPIEHRMVTNAIERAQKRVEDRNFAIRKQLLRFDDVMSRQREVIYAQRRTILLGKDEEVKEAALAMVEETVAGVAENYINPEIHPDDWDLASLKATLLDYIPAFETFEFEALRQEKAADAVEKIVQAGLEFYTKREEELGPPLMRAVERFVILNVVDGAWKEHLHNLDVLRQGIGLRAYGQRDPFQEYKFEATRLFNDMIAYIKGEVTKFLFRLKVEVEPPKPRAHAPVPPKAATPPARQATAAPQPAQARESGKKPKKIGRNDPCWCGSGKKYKHCHGRS